MSQLRQAAIASTEDSHRFIQITWSDFVSVVIELTIETYREMRQSDAIRQSEENVFTINLEDYLRPIAFNRDQSIYVHSRKKQHTSKMKNGKQPTIRRKGKKKIPN